MKGIAALALGAVGVLVAALSGSREPAILTDGPVAGWGFYGGDPGGARYSPLAQITRENVGRLRVAWTYRTGDVSDGSQHANRSSFEATPILFRGSLYLSTPFSRVIALDPETGEERWAYDPGIDLSVRYSENLVSRGVAGWEDPRAPAGSACGARIFFGTLDARLLALDAETGRPCVDFGTNGEVDLKVGIGAVERGEYEVTSPPVVVGVVVVVGSAQGDNRAVEVERGVVRGFDARTGALRWSWDPIPRAPGTPGYEAWTPEAARKTRAGNAWAPLSADPERDLVFVPTGSAAPDYYGGERLGKNPFTDAVVALRASTGELVWFFQAVHHDLWDYDVPSQPVLTTVRRQGAEVPAVVQATKMGHLFVLHRETGAPLFPVEERPVPRSTVPGEQAWPTQPFPTAPAPLHPTELGPEDAWGLTPWDRGKCRERIERARYEGIFTPPSLEGTILYPGVLGGSNWGSVAVDPARGLAVLNMSRFASWVRLIPRDSFDLVRRQPPGPGHYAPQRWRTASWCRRPVSRASRRRGGRSSPSTSAPGSCAGRFRWERSGTSRRSRCRSVGARRTSGARS